MSFGSVWKRYGCCDGPAHMMKGIGSNFVVQGFNYRAIPQWFRENSTKNNNFEGCLPYLTPLIPIRSSTNHLNLMYEFSFAEKPCAEPKREWYIRTSDDIVPNIFETISQKEMKVKREKFHNGYTTWLVTC